MESTVPKREFSNPQNVQSVPLYTNHQQTYRSFGNTQPVDQLGYQVPGTENRVITNATGFQVARPPVLPINTPAPSNRPINLKTRDVNQNLTIPTANETIPSNNQNISQTNSNVAPTNQSFPTTNIPATNSNIPTRTQNPPSALFRRNPSQMSRNDSVPNFSINFRLNKMDMIFAESFKSVKCEYIFHIVCVAVLVISFWLVYKFQVFKNVGGQEKGIFYEDQQFKQSLMPFLFAFQMTVLFCKLFIYFNTYSRLIFALETAQRVSHSVLGQEASTDLTFDENTSRRMVLAQNQVTVEQGLDEIIKKTQLSLTQNKIKLSMKTQMFCTFQIHELMEFAMLVCSICMIVCLAQSRSTWIEKLLMITAIVYWFLQNSKTVVLLILLALCPLLTLIGIIVVCVMLNRQEQRKEVKLPQTIHPTQEQILNCGGSCSICMTDFSTDSDVVVLPCSDKHVFHEMCIKMWLNVKTTCPNCRFDLAEA